MNVERVISGMNRDEILEAMELIWRRLSDNVGELPSPSWHEQVIRDRLANPSSDSLALDESKSYVMDRLNERRTQGRRPQ